MTEGKEGQENAGEKTEEQQQQEKKLLGMVNFGLVPKIDWAKVRSIFSFRSERQSQMVQCQERLRFY